MGVEKTSLSQKSVDNGRERKYNNTTLTSLAEPGQAISNEVKLWGHIEPH